MGISFKDRKQAGEMLAQRLAEYHGTDSVIIGLPRGGVVVAYEVSRALGLPLDIIVPRKIGAPGDPEFALGAITEEGKPFLNQELVRNLQVEPEYLENEIDKEIAEANRRLHKYRGNRPPLDLRGKTAIIIDDGIATGATMFAAIESAKIKGASKIIVGVPVAAADTLKIIKEKVDEVICLEPVDNMGAISFYYEHFPQIEDDEVIKLMRHGG